MYCVVKPGRRGAGFTLVELLVVIAIIMILAALLLPVLAKAKDSAKSTLCKSRLKQFGLALGMYLDDNQMYPDFGGMGLLEPYLLRYVIDTEFIWDGKVLPSKTV